MTVPRTTSERRHTKRRRAHKPRDINDTRAGSPGNWEMIRLRPTSFCTFGFTMATPGGHKQSRNLLPNKRFLAPPHTSRAGERLLTLHRYSRVDEKGRQLARNRISISDPQSVQIWACGDGSIPFDFSGIRGVKLKHPFLLGNETNCRVEAKQVRYWR